MSSLNSLFNRGLLGAKCKTCLTLAISRIKLLRNKRDVQLAQMRKEIFQFLQTGQEPIARIRVEHVIREQNILAAYEMIELFCEFILARVPILDTQRTCPPELQEAIASVIFAAPRCSDVQELIQIKNLFTTKYGKEFVNAASELQPDCGVNRVIIEKLSVKTPPVEVRLAVLKGIAKELNLEWDSSNTEAEFSKKHEDLLNGQIPVVARSTAREKSLVNPSSPEHRVPVMATDQNQVIRAPEAPVMVAKNRCPTFNSNLADTNKTKIAVTNQTEKPHVDEKPTINQSSCDALEKARAAISAAERACAAARAAVKLVEAKVDYQSRKDEQCA